MRSEFWWGVTVVYVALVSIALELFVEPQLKSSPTAFRVSGLVLLIAGSLWFTFAVVATKAHLEFESHAMPNGAPPPGTAIAGIVWHTRLTELRFDVTNPTGSDYHDLDITVRPDKWTYRAALDTPTKGCELTRVDGLQTYFVTTGQQSGDLRITATRVGAGFEPHDSQGNIYSVLASGDGYRLRCQTLPAHFTARIVFASVTVLENLKPSANAPVMFGEEIAGAKSEFDLFDTRPFPFVVVAEGSYSRRWKPFSTADHVLVHAGN